LTFFRPLDGELALAFHWVVMALILAAARRTWPPEPLEIVFVVVAVVITVWVAVANRGSGGRGGSSDGGSCGGGCGGCGGGD